MNGDLTLLYKCRKTIIELLRDRKYNVPLVFDCEKFSDFKQLHINKQLDIFVKEPKKCYVKFIVLNKTRPQLIREYIEDIQSKYTEADGNIILILKNKPHNSLFKVSKEYKNIQFFWLDELVNNITHHRLNPKFEKLSENEIVELLKKYNLKSKLSLPLMLPTDAISKYFNFKSGDVCRITKISPTNGIYISYRNIK